MRRRLLIISLIVLALFACSMVDAGAQEPYTGKVTLGQTSYSAGEAQVVGATLSVTEPVTISTTTLVLGPMGELRFLDGGFAQYYSAGTHRAPIRYVMTVPDEPGDWQWIMVFSDPGGWLWVSNAVFAVH